MSDPRHISIQDFSYDLPEEKIALHPLEERDASRLLIYRNGKLSEDVYKNIAAQLPQESLLIFNNSKVINARIRFQKATGGIIEIFCLEPHEQINEYSSVMGKTGSVKWKCFVGGVSKWKEGMLQKQVDSNGQLVMVYASMIEKISDAYIIEFSWTPADKSFSEIIALVGDVPLPPYIKRSTDAVDAGRYQTIYAKHDGSVAAPTAGLHFTENIFAELSKKKIEKAYITLHVGAGTFKPVKVSMMKDHEMHAEWIDVSRETIQKIMLHEKPVVAIGTTSARSIETLYWLGVKVLRNPCLQTLELKQWDVYESPLKDIVYSKQMALDALIKWLDKHNRQNVFTQTQLLISSGYQFKIINALVTNFHQPQSTLLLLVAAAVGENWKMIYDYALKEGFRFLSYGDGNLIFID